MMKKGEVAFASTTRKAVPLTLFQISDCADLMHFVEFFRQEGPWYRPYENGWVTVTVC